MEVGGQLHTPAALPLEKLPPGTYWIGGWVGPRAGLDAVERKPSCPCWESNPDSSALYPVGRRYADSSGKGSCEKR
jgi:hypothetical protein